MNDCRAAALAYLTRREYSQGELKQKLLIRGYLPEIVDDVLVKLSDSGLQSDERFVSTYISSKISSGKGPVYIKAALKKYAVSPQLIETHLLKTPEFWYEQLMCVWQKKYHRAIPNDDKMWFKQTQFLLRRGFEWDSICHCLHKIKRDAEVPK